MVKKILMFFVMFCTLVTMNIDGEAKHLDTKQVAFVVQDYGTEIEKSDYKDWKAVTRWAYRYPYYQIHELDEAEQVSKMLATETIDSKTLAEAAQFNDMDVIVLVQIRELEEEMMHGMFSVENGPFVKVTVRANLLVYRHDTGKILTDVVDERDVREMGNYTKPGEIIKWRLCDLVNTMEGRELIR